MRTVLTESTEEAAAFIKLGGIVAFPTETVYGLGADVFNEAAVAQIFEAKQRPADNPLIAHISERGQISSLTVSVPQTAELLIAAFFPGPLTLVLPKAESVPLAATAGLDTIGIRMPNHDRAIEFLRSCRTPVAAPSANLSGRPSPTSWRAVVEDLEGRIDCILQGDNTEFGLESTVVDCSSDVPVLLRHGSVILEQLKAIVPTIIMADRSSDDVARSPGMKHKHYSPRGHVIIIDNDSPPSEDRRCSFIGLNQPSSEFAYVKLCSDLDEYARSLFEFFRESDRRGIDEICCEAIPEEGIGIAIMDRLRRASAK